MNPAPVGVVKNIKNVADSNSASGKRSDGMAMDPDARDLKLLLLERAPGSLAKVRDIWPEAQISVEVHCQAHGVVDLILQEELQMVICDMMVTDSPGALTIQALRRVHPDLLLVAVLPEPSLALALTAFRSGATDVLIHPLDKAALLDSWSRISARLQQGTQKTIAPQSVLAIENMQLVERLQEKNREAELAHAALVKLHEDRTRFVCNLSHELKTPLTSVLGFADLLHNFYDQVDPARLQEYVGRIYDKGKHLERLLTGMLRLFSLDSGNEDWQWQELSLRDSLAQVLQKYEDEIDARQLDMQGDLRPIRGDQDKLELLLAALVDNAVKFNRTGGLLSIKAENTTLRGNAMVYLQVFNQGQSVQHEHAEDIFQGYSQLGDLDADKPSGVGIGLATCRAILRQMHGEIYLEPIEDGEGTSFALLMPTGEIEMELNHG